MHYYTLIDIVIVVINNYYYSYYYTVYCLWYSNINGCVYLIVKVWFVYGSVYQCTSGR